MSFPFYSAIPQAGDDPSISQGEMLQNFSSIGNPMGSWATQDHYGFQTGTDGEHKQVTFAGNNVPTVPTNPPVLFTNVQDGAGNALPNGLAQLFFYSGTVNQGKSQYVSAANGSVLLTGGIIIKWGTTGILSAGSNPLTFASFGIPDFPNNQFVCLAIKTLTGTGSISADSTGGTTGFTLFLNTGAGATAYWLCIGN